VKIIFNIIAVLLILMGAAFFLQGINILPGSYMSGDPKWAVNGAIALVAGIVILVLTNRRKKQ
jgi:hypothetical protein